MSYSEDIVDIFIDNLKKIFFPEDWINLDLKFSKFEIFTLLFLDRIKETTMTELVEYINCPMSTATGIVDRLVRKGYVRRERSDTDRRIVVLGLTEEGSRFVTDLKDQISEYLNLALGDLTEEEQQFLINTVFKIMNNLQARFSGDAIETKEKEEITKIEIE